MMNWEKLLSSKRLGKEENIDRLRERSEFERDFDRLIFSAPFRRLQNKTQVFPLPGSVFVHNRLTHSLEVSCVGRSLGNDVARRIIARHPELAHTHLTEIGNIVSAACLAHDLGNPPFGHSGEKAIRLFFTEGKGTMLKDFKCPISGQNLSPETWSDIIHFDGNANTFRVLTHHFIGKNPSGFDLTYSTLASVVKYPYSSNCSNKPKYGFFHTEKDTYQIIAEELGIPRLPSANDTIRYARHPLVFLVEAADDICYRVMDLEDAHNMKILSTERTEQILLNFFSGEERAEAERRIQFYSDKNSRISFLRSIVVNRLEQECVKVFVDHEQEILAGEFDGPLINHITPLVSDANKLCTEVNEKEIYHSNHGSIDVELVGFRILISLLEMGIQAIMRPNTTYSEIIFRRVSPQYDVFSPNLDNRTMALLDYITGMTDMFAFDLYQRSNAMLIPNL